MNVGPGAPADWLVTAEDWPALRLETAPDDHARLCRAWLLQGVAAHPDHAAAAAWLSRVLATDTTSPESTNPESTNPEPTSPDETTARDVLSFLTRSMAGFRRGSDDHPPHGGMHLQQSSVWV